MSADLFPLANAVYVATYHRTLAGLYKRHLRDHPDRWAAFDWDSAARDSARVARTAKDSFYARVNAESLEGL